MSKNVHILASVRTTKSMFQQNKCAFEPFNEKRSSEQLLLVRGTLKTLIFIESELTKTY